MGAVGGTACPAYAFSLLSVVFCSCFDLLCVYCDCYLLCICLKTGDRLGMKRKEVPVYLELVGIVICFVFA